jgi:hypothetical protein
MYMYFVVLTSFGYCSDLVSCLQTVWHHLLYENIVQSFERTLTGFSGYIKKNSTTSKGNCISGVMFNILDSGVVDRGFEPPVGSNQRQKIGICCFSAKHTLDAVLGEGAVLLAWNRDNVYECGDMSICRLLFQ